MGKTSYGFLEGFSGRLGNMIGYRWRGRMCVRSMPSHYRDARTPDQLRQRALFKAVVGLAARARQVLKVGMRQVSLDAQMTESNYFMRINKRCFAMTVASEASTEGLMTGDGVTATVDGKVATDAGSSVAEQTTTGQGMLTIDYENLLLADGPVAPVAFNEVQMVDESTLKVCFEKNPLRRTARSEDLVYLAAYCPELDEFDLSLPAYRRSNAVTISLNPYWAGREVHLWGFVVDSKGRASQSQYIGGGEMATDTKENSTGQPITTDGHASQAGMPMLQGFASQAGMPVLQDKVLTATTADERSAALQQDIVPEGVEHIFRRHRIRC